MKIDDEEKLILDSIEKDNIILTKPSRDEIEYMEPFSYEMYNL